MSSLGALVRGPSLGSGPVQAKRKVEVPSSTAWSRRCCLHCSSSPISVPSASGRALVRPSAPAAGPSGASGSTQAQGHARAGSGSSRHTQRRANNRRSQASKGGPSWRQLLPAGPDPAPLEAVHAAARACASWEQVRDLRAVLLKQQQLGQQAAAVQVDTGYAACEVAGGAAGPQGGLKAPLGRAAQGPHLPPLQALSLFTRLSQVHLSPTLAFSTLSSKAAAQSDKGAAAQAQGQGQGGPSGEGPSQAQRRLQPDATEAQPQGSALSGTGPREQSEERISQAMQAEQQIQQLAQQLVGDVLRGLPRVSADPGQRADTAAASHARHRPGGPAPPSSSSSPSSSSPPSTASRPALPGGAQPSQGAGSTGRLRPAAGEQASGAEVGAEAEAQSAQPQQQQPGPGQDHDRLSRAEQVAQLLCAMARLGYQGPRAHVVQVAELLRAPPALKALPPEDLTTCAWALAKLGHDPGAAWISSLLSLSAQGLPAFSPLDLSASAWALARWGFRPADAWFAAFYARLKQVAPAMGPLGLANVAWALATLKVSPPREVAELLMIEAQVSFPTFTGAGLGTLCWALASLSLRPPNFWIEDCLTWAGKRLAAIPLSALGLPFANLAWALSNWQASPSPAWLAQFVGAAARHLPVMRPRSLAVLVLGLADLGYQPDRAWVSLALEEFHKRHGDADAHTLVSMVWAVSRLLRPLDQEAAAQWAPDRKWLVRYAHILQDLADAISVRFGELKPPDLVDAAVAFADLRFYPGAPWLARHEAYCNACVGDFTVYQMKLLSNTVGLMDVKWQANYLPRKGELV